MALPTPGAGKKEVEVILLDNLKDRARGAVRGREVHLLVHRAVRAALRAGEPLGQPLTAPPPRETPGPVGRARGLTLSARPYDRVGRRPRRRCTSSASARAARTRSSSASRCFTCAAAAFCRVSSTARIDGIHDLHDSSPGNRSRLPQQQLVHA